MTHGAMRDPGSFRDPAGEVCEFDGRIFRAIHSDAQPHYDSARASGALDRLQADGLLIASTEVDRAALPLDVPAASRVVEHPRLTYVSYPYEWCFSGLRDAALLHLDIQERLLADGYVLSDSTAYNVQFDGARPLFIDLLSVRAYRQGEYWAGYRQFCEQFLNPLLLTSHRGVPFNAWYRGALEGLPTVEVAPLLGARTRLSWLKLLHVHLPAAVERRMRSNAKPAGRSSRPLSQAAYRGLLRQMRKLVGSLSLQSAAASTWSDYADVNSYSSDETAQKIAAVRAFVEQARPATVWDMGCNTGVFSEAALAGGCHAVVGFDADPMAIEKAYARARARELRLLPLVVDLANPSPGQGWEGMERRSLTGRGRPDAMIALALIHHLVVGRNIPLERALRWLISLAPRGVIEFVPKSDPMVQQMLATRDDIFTGYDRQSVSELISRHARLERTEVVSTTGRELFIYSST